MIVVLIGMAMAAGLITVVVSSRRPTVPIRSMAGRIVTFLMAGLAAVMVVISTQSDFWLVTEAESEVTARYAEDAMSGVNFAAVLVALGTTGLILAATVGRRSFGGMGVVASWVLLGAVWFGYWVDDSSTRSSAELRPGTTQLTWGVGLLAVAAMIRWAIVQVERRRGMRAADPTIF